MNFIINKDKLEITEPRIINSGSIAYYSVDCEFDDSWNGLVKKAVLIKKGESQGTEVAVVDNQIYIDKEYFGDYFVGFVGYVLNNENQKIRQISTNLEGFQVDNGAGEIETIEPPIPTTEEWEIYIQQLQAIADLVSADKDIVVSDTEYVRGAKDEVAGMKEDVEELADGVRNMATAIQLPQFYVDNRMRAHGVFATKLSNIDLYIKHGKLMEGVIELE